MPRRGGLGRRTGLRLAAICLGLSIRRIWRLFINHRVGEQDLTNLAEDGYVFRCRRIDVLSFEWMIFASLHSWTSNRGGSHTQVGVVPSPKSRWRYPNWNLKSLETALSTSQWIVSPGLPGRSWDCWIVLQHYGSSETLAVLPGSTTVGRSSNEAVFGVLTSWWEKGTGKRLKHWRVFSKLVVHKLRKYQIIKNSIDVTKRERERERERARGAIMFFSALKLPMCRRSNRVLNAEHIVKYM